MNLKRIEWPELKPFPLEAVDLHLSIGLDYIHNRMDFNMTMHSLITEPSSGILREISNLRANNTE